MWCSRGAASIEPTLGAPTRHRLQRPRNRPLLVARLRRVRPARAVRRADPPPPGPPVRHLPRQADRRRRPSRPLPPPDRRSWPRHPAARPVGPRELSPEGARAPSTLLMWQWAADRPMRLPTLEECLSDLSRHPVLGRVRSGRVHSGKGRSGRVHLASIAALSLRASGCGATGRRSCVSSHWRQR